MRHHRTFLLVAAAAAAAFLPFSDAQGPRMDWETYDPPSTLIVPETTITRAKFPFIDVHSHQWRMAEQDLSPLVAEMDALNMGILVNLSGRGGFQLEAMMRSVNEHFPSRFAIFTNLDFNNVDEAGWTDRAVAQLETDVANGAKGLKVFKSLGMSNTDTQGRRIPVDHPAIGPVWERCGELGIPVLIHTADPKAFWSPRDEQNERWLELKTHPRRQRSDDDPAPWEQLMAEQHRVFKSHPRTNFINAHLGWYANDLDSLGRLLDEMPNMYTEIGAVIAELGRQPRQARQFLERYQDRVLFGKDAYNPEEYYTYFRVLESDDEYFPYYKRYHAFWRMYGLALPDEILKKLYYKNALAIIPGLDGSIFPD